MSSQNAYDSFEINFKYSTEKKTRRLGLDVNNFLTDFQISNQPNFDWQLLLLRSLRRCVKNSLLLVFSETSRK